MSSITGCFVIAAVVLGIVCSADGSIEDSRRDMMMTGDTPYGRGSDIVLNGSSNWICMKPTNCEIRQRQLRLTSGTVSGRLQSVFCHYQGACALRVAKTLVAVGEGQKPEPVPEATSCHYDNWPASKSFLWGSQPKLRLYLDTELQLARLLLMPQRICHTKRNSELINSLLGLPKNMNNAGK